MSDDRSSGVLQGEEAVNEARQQETYGDRLMQIAIDAGLRPRPPSSCGFSILLSLPRFPPSPAIRRNGLVAGIQTPRTQQATPVRRASPARCRLLPVVGSGREAKTGLEQGKGFDRAGNAGPLNSPGWYRRAAVVGLSCYFS